MEAEQLRILLEENRQLQADNARLRELLQFNKIDPNASLPAKPVNEAPSVRVLPTADELASIEPPASKAHKIELFRSLFRGREDVYAVRFQSRATGEWGYAPDGETDWSASAVVRTSGPGKRPRRYFPLTDSVVYEHLTGKKTIGSYALLQDETCWFLAADFDKDEWKEDALAYVAAAKESGIRGYLERSRSGKGGHVWIFFDVPVSASLARKLGCFLLSRAMEHRHRLALSSYDRLFPNQDTMPKGGFGNLIALPLQWMLRREGNSEFVGDNLTPYPDQWKLLKSVRRVALDHLDWTVVQATRQGAVIAVRAVDPDPDDLENEPWRRPPSRKVALKPIEGPFPPDVEPVLSNMLFVPKGRIARGYAISHRPHRRIPESGVL